MPERTVVAAIATRAAPMVLEITRLPPIVAPVAGSVIAGRNPIPPVAKPMPMITAAIATDLRTLPTTNTPSLGPFITRYADKAIIAHKQSVCVYNNTNAAIMEC